MFAEPLADPGGGGGGRETGGANGHRGGGQGESPPPQPRPVAIPDDVAFPPGIQLTWQISSRQLI